MPAGDPPLTLRDLDAISTERVRRAAPRACSKLAEMGIVSVLDLLQHYPRRYLDRTRRTDMAELSPDEEAYVVGRVLRVSRRTTRRGSALVTMRLRDATGDVELVFFNQGWIADKHSPGDTVIAFGKMRLYRGRLQMTGPVIDPWGDQTGRLVPVYPQSSGKDAVRSWDMARLVARALDLSAPRGIADPVPARVLEDRNLISREQALNRIHRPSSAPEWMQARRRLVFDELLRVQLELVRRQRRMRITTAGVEHRVDGDLVDRFHRHLPFELTSAQRRVTLEISDDLAEPWPMNRLLQGDVGSGKTVVALGALLTAVQGGMQGVLMAPTEVLAEQHASTIADLLDGLTVPDSTRLSGNRPLRVELLTGRARVSKRRDILAGLAMGSVDIVVGTHALISEGVEYRALAVVVIDEQHRFGVEQRARLRDKGPGSTMPDMLVMTATPIPRTAAMTVYGDLDVSVLDELPVGRTPIITRRAHTPEQEADVWEEVRRAVAQQHQAYVVCPLIEDSPSLAVRSVTEIHERLTAADGELHDLRVGLLHGRVPSTEKEATMELFRRGLLDVLVATTVIEVGVDVPNATVMVIMDAHRFGIAQLHQLRGRVGRGSHASVCYLMGAATTDEGDARLKAVAEIADGFELAEIDLKLRGEGTIMGVHQKGRNDLRLASLRRHREWVEDTRAAALRLVDANGGLGDHRDLDDEVDFVFGDDATAEFLLKS